MATVDHGPEIAAVGIAFLTLSWVAVSLRCYVRIFITRSFGADDWLSITALVITSMIRIVGDIVLTVSIDFVHAVLRSCNYRGPIWHWPTHCRSFRRQYIFEHEGMLRPIICIPIY